MGRELRRERRMTRPLSLLLDEKTYDRLLEASRRYRTAKGVIARRAIQKGLAAACADLAAELEREAQRQR